MNISKRSRELYDELSRGFNTWDLQSVTAHVLLPERLRVHFSFFVTHTNLYTGDILWENTENFGEHSVDGSYTEIWVKFENGIYRVESSGDENSLVVRITPEKTRCNMYISCEVGEMFGQTFSFSYRDGNVVAVQDGKEFVVRSLNPAAPVTWDPSTCPHLVAKADETTYFSVNSDKTPAEIDTLIQKKRDEWMNKVIHSTGDMGEALTAMRRSLLWNMVYDFEHKRVITPVSRNWCRRTQKKSDGFGDYVLFDWDTFFAGLQYGLIDKRLAYSTTLSILEEVTPEGMIPNYGCGSRWSRDRSEPQVGAMCVWKLYIQFQDKWFLEECFDTLYRWNNWRFQYRDGNNDGLLELGSTPWEFTEIDEGRSKIACGAKQGAKWESGLDNSTMWDDVPFDTESHCMELSYVGLNALMAADCEILEKIARVIGKNQEADILKARKEKLGALINSELWDDSVNCYRNKLWDGTFHPCMSLTHFYPMMAGIVNEERLNHLIQDHLLNEDEFWGEYIIPNISKQDPTFPEQEYWRGRVWAPTNFLVGEGIIRTGKKDVWSEVVRKGFHMFTKCWNEKGVVGENYNAITGEAAEKGAHSDKFYHWGALLVYMAVERCINFNEWTDEVEMSDRPDWIEEIKNIPVGDKMLNV